VRPLLFERRAEDLKALSRLSDDQRVDLHDQKTARRNRQAAAQAARPASRPGSAEPNLFDLIDGEDTTP
jgi:hypothetical protein